MKMMDTSLSASRRRFLRQTFAFSALAALGSVPAAAAPRVADASEEANLLMIGDWGYDSHHEGQASVAAAMRKYAQEHHVTAQALLMLGDNWYGALDGGAKSDRWQTGFEQMYPADAFACPAYAILGNHDYQRMPVSKVDAELEYAQTAKSRWTMPAKWYTFTFPEKKPLITFIALDSNYAGRGRQREPRRELYADGAGAGGAACVAGDGAEEAAHYAVPGGDGASSGVFRWAAWRPSGADSRLGPAVAEVQGGPVSGRGTITICSIWSLRIIRQASFCRAAAGRIFMT